MIPIAHIFVLIKIIGLVRFDVKTEEDRKERNDARAADKVCKTKYPIILVILVISHRNSLFARRLERQRKTR